VSMVPALRIDYAEVARRVDALKSRLDEAVRADVRFLVKGRAGGLPLARGLYPRASMPEENPRATPGALICDLNTRLRAVEVDPHTKSGAPDAAPGAGDDRLEYGVRFDLRHRTAHASTGRFPEAGTAGNLPSGEAYIVPYEGEKGVPSDTAGVLPVEIDGEVVLFTVVANKAVRVEGDGPAADAEREHLLREPAYGNMAELGFGVLAAFGLAPVGEILLDEKLGLHVAFGRSEHFGGIVGPKDFSSRAEVIHLDRIYIPESMPRVAVRSVTFGYPDGRVEIVMSAGRYSIFKEIKENA